MILKVARKQRTNHPNRTALRGFANNKKIPEVYLAATMLYLGEIGWALHIFDPDTDPRRFRNTPMYIQIERLLDGEHRANTPGYKMKAVFRVLRRHIIFKEDARNLSLPKLTQMVNRLVERFFMKGIRQDISPYPHQIEAAELVSKNGRMIFNHGTGTGKTLSALLAFDRLKKEGKCEKMLAVVPTSLRDNFVTKGVKKFTNYKVAVFGNKSEVQSGAAYGLDNFPRNVDVYVVGYSMYRKNPKAYLHKTGAKLVVYDEFHAIKGGTTLTAKAVEATQTSHPYMIGMTASLVSNNPEEILPLIEAVSSGQHGLGKNEKEFRKKFFDYKHKFFGLGKKTNIVQGLQNKGKLGGELRKFIHHVKSLDQTEMPMKVTQIVHVQMSEHQQKLYDYVLDQLPPALVRKMKRGAETLSEEEIGEIYHKFWQMRQVANSIHAVDPVSLTESARKTPKVKKLLDDLEMHLASHSDPRVMIYTNLVKAGIDVITAGLKDRKIKFGIFAGVGVTSEGERQQAVRDYLAGKIRVIVASPAGSEGVSLNGTTMIQMLDGHFNPEKNRQAAARGIRAGDQKHLAPKDRKVIVKQYMSTVPPKFFGLQQDKTIDQVIYDKAAQKDVLNDELRELLKDPKSNV